MLSDQLCMLWNTTPVCYGTNSVCYENKFILEYSPLLIRIASICVTPTVSMKRIQDNIAKRRDSLRNK